MPGKIGALHHTHTEPNGCQGGENVECMNNKFTRISNLCFWTDAELYLQQALRKKKPN